MITITEADIKKLAPKAKPEYLAALKAGMGEIEAAGLLDSELRWCHFIAQCAHETGGFTIIRESLTYTSVKRIREVWPARFRAKPDEELQKLVRDPIALGDAVYMGRMGNDKPGDGFAYRGGGWMQTTGRSALCRYADECGLEPSGDLLDDCSVTLRFALIEWERSGCQALADANDLLGVSRVINVGSATTGVTPVGLDGRKEWFAKAWAIWGDKGKADKPAKKPMTVREALLKVGAPVVVVGELAKQGVPAVPEIATKSIEHVGAWRGIGKSLWGFGSELALVPWWMIAGGLSALGVLAFLKIRERNETSD